MFNEGTLIIAGGVVLLVAVPFVGNWAKRAIQGRRSQPQDKV